MFLYYQDKESEPKVHALGSLFCVATPALTVGRNLPTVGAGLGFFCGNENTRSAPSNAGWVRTAPPRQARWVATLPFSKLPCGSLWEEHLLKHKS
jgi:hypothetical protein